MSLADRLAQARRDRTPLIEERPNGQQRTTAAGRGWWTRSRT